MLGVVWGGGLCVGPPTTPGGQGVMLSLDAGAARQGGGGHYTLQLLYHSPAVVCPPSSLPSSRGVSFPTLFTSSVFQFQSVTVSPLVPLHFFVLLPLTFTRQVWGGWYALLHVTEFLQSATVFGRSPLRVGPQKALPPVLWLDRSGSEFLSSFSVGVTLPRRALRWLWTCGRKWDFYGKQTQRQLFLCVSGLIREVRLCMCVCEASYHGPVGSC